MSTPEILDITEDYVKPAPKRQGLYPTSMLNHQQQSYVAPLAVTNDNVNVDSGKKKKKEKKSDGKKHRSKKVVNETDSEGEDSETYADEETDYEEGQNDYDSDDAKKIVIALPDSRVSDESFDEEDSSSEDEAVKSVDIKAFQKMKQSIAMLKDDVVEMKDEIGYLKRKLKGSSSSGHHHHKEKKTKKSHSKRKDRTTPPPTDDENDDVGKWKTVKRGKDRDEDGGDRDKKRKKKKTYHPEPTVEFVDLVRKTPPPQPQTIQQQ